MKKNNRMDPDQEKPVDRRHAPNINDLPDELLIKIMSNLTLFNRKRMRQVCTYWNKISYEKSLIKDDWMVVPTLKDLERLEGRPPNRKFINLRIHDMKADFSNCCVWQKFGPFIQKVELYVSDIRNPVFACIFKYCNDLRSVRINGFYKHSTEYNDTVTFAQSIPNDALSALTSITLYDPTGDLTDAEFNSLTKNSLGLTRVSLDSCPSLDYKNVKNLLIQQSSVLTHLSLTNISVSEEILLDLLSCVGKQLISLELIHFTHLLSDNSLIKICNLFPNLEGINLTETEITDKGAKKLFRCLKKLKCIDFCDTSLTNFALKDMFRLDNLTSIKLSSLEKITDVGLVPAFTQRLLPKLETLSLNGLFKWVYDEVIWNISPMIPNVSWLDLGYTDVTAFGVQSLICYNKKLRFLSLFGCLNLNDMFTDTPSINDLEELRELEFDFNPGLDDSSIRRLSLERLRKLNLMHGEASMDTDGDLLPWPTSCFAKLIKRCPSLEAVEMPFEMYPDDIDTSGLSARAKKILPLPCHCGFSPKKHLTQICQV